MIRHYRYTETELKTLLKSMAVLIDTREQDCNHVTTYLDKAKVQHKSRKLDFGDYSFYLPANAELSIPRDLYFDGQIAIERKGSLAELSTNLTAKRAEFEAEMIRAAGAKLILMIEDASYEDILQHNYRTQYDPKAFVAALKTFEYRYGLDINFVSRQTSGHFIYSSLYYYLREYLK